MEPTERIRSVLIDDERTSRETLKALLGEFFPEVELVGLAANGLEGLKIIEEQQPELVFLDVEMPGLNGLEVLEKVKSSDFELIFTTAHKDYSLDAIRFSALDYLLKPISIEELSIALQKVREKKYTRSLAERLRVLEEHLSGVRNRSMRIALPAREGLTVVQVQTIIRCEGENNYTHFHFEDGRKLLVSKTLREFEDLLSGAGFFRIFQSHLINLRFVEEYLRGRGGSVRMSDGSLLPVSRDRKKELLEQLSSFQ